MSVARDAPKVVVYVAPEATTLDEVLTRLSADPRCISEGRVFVGKNRASRADVPVGAGVTVRLTREAPRAGADVVVLHRSEHLLVVDKPAGIPTIADGRSRAGSLLAEAARVTGLPEERLHPTSRLDRDVSGVVTFALSARARDELGRAREAGTYGRRYVALSARAPTPPEGTCDAPIGPGRDPRHRRVDPKGEPSRSKYAVVAEAPSGPGGARAALLALGPETGRTHQLRVHSSHLGAPLLGDTTYGGPSRLALPTGKILGFSRVMLHCAKVRFVVGGEALELVSPVPEALRSTWASLGGGEGAWEEALAWSLFSTGARP